MSPNEKLAAFIAETQSLVRRVGEAFDDPEDDWMHVAFLQGEEGTSIVGMSGEMFSTELSKDVLAEWLRSAMQSLHAERYAVLFNTYGLRNPSEADWEEHRKGKRLSQFDNSYEMLLIVAGDADQEVAAQAEISRDGVNPPTLGEWMLLPHIEGRFSNLNARMRKVGVA